MKFILKIIKPQRLKIYVSLIFKSIGTFADLVLPLMIVFMIDDLIPDLKSGERQIHELYILGILMVIVAGVGLYLNILANRRAEKIASTIIFDLRNVLFAKITTLESSQVDTFTRASLISRMTSDTYNIYGAIASLQRIGIRAPILLVGGVILSYFLDPILTLVMISALPFIWVLVIYATKKGKPFYKRSQMRADRVVRTLREYISGVRIIRALGMEDHEIDKYDAYNKHLIETELEAHKVMAKINPILGLIMNLGLVAVLFVGVYRFKTGAVKDGVIIAFVTYFTIILNAMMSITRIFTMLTRASASASRIEEVLLSESDLKDGTLTSDKSHMDHVVFDHVFFSYSNKEPQLSDISFTLKKGQTLGILGATGSGKTTLVNLILRFYDVTKGQISIYGTPIQDLKKSEFRKDIGVVFQNDIVFANSIYDNIKLFRSSIDDEDVDASIDIAQANFIYEKSDAAHHLASQRGANLSGGQKQRILIARALASKPDLLILDDASSALDYKTDQQLRASISKHFDQTTKIIIAQRISSIKDADLILLIDDGKVVAQGTHETLLKESALYKSTANYQMGVNYE